MAITPNRNRTTLSTVSAVVVSAPGPGVDRHVINLKFPNLDGTSTPDITLFRNIGGSSRQIERVTGLAVGSVWNPVDREHPLILKSADELIAVLSAAVSSPPDCNAEYIDKVAGSGTSAQPTSGQFSVLSQAVSALSNSLSALQSAHDALSNRVSVNSGVGGGGSVTSTELSAVSAQAASAISQEASIRSAKDDVLSQAISVLSQQLSVVSTKVDGVSAKSVGGSSVQGLQSVIQALSNRISAAGGGAGSVTSNELSIELEHRISVDNVLSTNIQAISDRLSNTDSVLYAAITSVDARVTSVWNVSVRTSTGGVSVRGLQSALNTLSTRISANSGLGGGGGSVTSTEFSALEVRVSTMSNVASNALSIASDARSIANAASAAGAALSLSHSALSTMVSILRSAISARSSNGTTSIRGMQSIIDLLSNRISATSNSLSALEVRVSAVSNVASNALSVANAAAAAASDVFSVAEIVLGEVAALSSQVSALSQGHSVISALLAGLSARLSTAGTSVKGLQSIIDTLSNRISANSGLGGGGGLTSDQVSAMIASAASTVYSVRLSTAGASVRGIQSALNTLSNRISANSGLGGGGGSVTSTEASAISATADSNLSLRASVLSAAIEVASAAATSVDARVNSVVAALLPPIFVRMTTGPQAIANSALTDISGLVFTVEASEQWHVSGMLLYSTSAATQGLRVGFSVPPLSTPRYALFDRFTAVQSAVGMGAAMQLQVSGASVVMSVTSTTPAGQMNYVKVNAVMNVASAGTVRLMAAGIASVAQSPINVAAGSYMLARRVV